MNTKIIAHRGASFLAKQENTLESFSLAIDMGVDYAEFDIRRTKDRQMVVFHNDALDGRKISDMSYAELCGKTRTEGYTVPLLSDVLKLCKGKIKLDIELKESGYENSIISLVKKFYKYEDYMMKSFIDKAVANIKSIDPNITAGLLLGEADANLRKRLHEYFPEQRLKACHADFVSPHYKLATPMFIHRMHMRRRKVYVWTINDPSLMGKYINRRVDGIITDKPDAGLYILKGYSI